MNEQRNNNRETGARKYPAAEPASNPNPLEPAALPRKKEPHGLTEKVDDTQEKTRQSDGQQPAEPRR